MSALVFPSFPGLGYGVHRIAIWRSLVQSSASGKEISVGYMSYPLYQWKLDFNVLRSTLTLPELNSLQGFFNKMSGRVDTFLFTDPEDNAVVDMQFGTGDGANKIFPLTRALGGYTEPVQSLNGAIVVKVNGVTKTLTTDYTINSLGVVSFVVAPANTAVITWTGSFYYRCRFLKDQLDLVQLFNQLWESKGLTFQSVKG